MSANYGKLDLLQREKIYKLKRAGRTGAEVQRALAQGWPNETPPIPPVEITVSAISHLWRKHKLETDELFSTKVQALATPDGLDVLTRRLLMIAERESQRFADVQSRRPLNVGELARLGALASATQRIHKLSRLRSQEPEPGRDRDQDAGSAAPAEPQSFASSLLDDEDGGAAPVADVPLPEPEQAPDPAPFGAVTD